MATRFTTINDQNPGHLSVRVAGNAHRSGVRKGSTSPPKKGNTLREHAKGESLLPKGTSPEAIEACPGTPATRNRGYCASSGAGVFVAKNPIAFGSFKCNRCISNKKGNCSFSVSNPGLDYDDAIIKKAQAIERRKGRAGAKRRETNA
ncbi:hypothetical protein GGR57DRAFT_482409, partial [Xylariaceae sp. FL1272]